MALEDEVFVGHKDLADFDNRWIREGTNSREIRICKADFTGTKDSDLVTQ